MNQIFTSEQIKENIISKLNRYYGVKQEEAEKEHIYNCVSLVLKDILINKRYEFREKIKKTQSKRVYFMCMEFLVGKSIKNNLYNLGLTDVFSEAVKSFGFSLENVFESEPDPGLGNGGLGRLAACYMDSLSTLGYAATGYSICYQYGFLKQKLLDGEQVELPDNWMVDGEISLVPRTDKTVIVKLNGHVSEKWDNGRLSIIHENCEEIKAVPYDMMITGYDSETVNVLRLWRAYDNKDFNMKLFTQGQYTEAMEHSNSAEIISKVLYPSDNHVEGKLLRLAQQYFLVSASLQTIIADHLAAYGSLYNFTEKTAIHLNDTHPALCIPELMRILLDTYSYPWEKAWYVVCHVFTYTNHTVMPEALECWNEDLFKLRLPRIYAIICEINRRFCAELWNSYHGDWNRISKMAVIAYNQIRMANLSVLGSSKVNGVSKLHSDILTKTIFHDLYKHTPEKFTNVTNGIAHRRWLCESNPALSDLITNCIGDSFIKKPETLINFAGFADDKSVILRLNEIKHENKINFSNYINKKTGIIPDPHSIFDVQVKRMHEYKRQLLNVLRIISIYNELRENPEADIRPQTFFFGAKAAPGYYMAKEIIKLISCISVEIEKNPKIREKLRVIFLEEYNVSLAEILMPASEISEQISLAGKEASGTGNMKFMLNGALTVATLDGANVEMAEAVGRDNIFIFGLETHEVDDLWKRGYNSLNYYSGSEKLRLAIDSLNTGFAGNSFSHIAHYLISGTGISDPYMCLADFDSYCITHDKVTELYNDIISWNKKSLINIAHAGKFASDRSITEYANDIWQIKPVTQL